MHIYIRTHIHQHAYAHPPLHQHQIEEEEKLRKRLGAGGSDALKPSLVEEIGKRLKDRLDGVTLVNDKPDVLALIDVLTLQQLCDLT